MEQHIYMKEHNLQANCRSTCHFLHCRCKIQSQRPKLSLCMGSVDRTIQTVSQNYHIWLWNLAIWNLSKVTDKHSFYSRVGVIVEIVLGLWTAVSEKQVNFQNCHLWPCTLAIDKTLHVYKLLYSLCLQQRVENLCSIIRLVLIYLYMLLCGVIC